MKRYLGLAAAFAAATMICAAQDTGTSQTEQPAGKTEQRAHRATADANWMTKALAGGKMEVELGTMATQNGSSQAVKDFGQRMVTDHTQANDELMALAKSKNVDLPANMDSKGKAAEQRFSKLTGAEFDRAYMAEMVRDHKQDVAEFRREAKSGKDPDVKAFAEKTLPTLEEHLKMAQQTEAELKK